jgi:ABC-type branched-subunit amino acid transport system ATPase component
MIQVSNIRKSFGGIRAVRGVSFTCEGGTITGLVGPNGSGKSTLVNLLTKMLTKDSGEIKIDGGFGRTFQDVRVWEHMTVLENVLLMTQAHGLLAALLEFRADETEARDIVARVGLLEYMHVPAKQLSYGQRKLLEIGRALGSKASNLFFDEPFAGLFPEMVERVKVIIKEEKMRGASIVLIEHDMSVIRELCDRIIVLDAGKIIAEGTTEEALNDPDVIHAYLGE